MSLSLEKDHYDYLVKKYGGLLRNICSNVSGDQVVLSCRENMYQELLIKMIEAVRGFEKKTGWIVTGKHYYKYSLTILHIF